MREVHIPALGRSVWIRPGTSDETAESVFETRYHIPPPMPTPRTVLDLGANIGLTAAHYKTLWPEATVWMLEPNPANMNLARINAPACVPIPCAVAPRSRVYWLREEGLSADAYTLGEDGEEGGRLVFGVGLADLISILRGVDFCKMDIEGTEWEVLDQLDGIERLLVEFHDEPRDYPSILERGLAALSEQGFKVKHHSPHPAAVFACR